MYKILEQISSPADLKKFDPGQLKELAGEMREEILKVTSRKGGHLAASLGAVELAVALHYCFDSPRDKIIWDVGHQSYAHKLLTGRRKYFDTLRELGGLSGFPNKDESEHDAFTCGHSSTSVSSALGLACARDLNGEDFKVVAVIGDASLSTGLAFEGLNNAGHMNTNIIVVLNDNEQFISKPVGAMSRYLNKVIANPLYIRVKEEAEKVVKSIPKLGPSAYKKVRKFQEGLKNLIVPGILFEELGFRYFGPVDGHNIDELVTIIRNTLHVKEPVFIHAITKKGKGYKYAEENPEKFHGVSAFDVSTGEILERENGKSFTSIFSRKIVKLAEKDEKIITITAAMPDGTGLQEFSEKFPDRFYDVGITEPHAVTFAAGLAKGGFKPVVAIYSTFLQRSYDQLIHDVALQNLPVIFCVDRAGLVGKDGPTHHGMFDIAYTRTLPNFAVMAPKDGAELEMMLEKALEYNRPVVIRYPRGEASQLICKASYTPIEFGRSECLRKGKNVAIIAVGSMVNYALQAAEVLSKKRIETTVVNARFIKPLDAEMLEEVLGSSRTVFTLEEGVLDGGFGSAILEFTEKENITGVKIKCFGLPDKFIEHGARDELLRKYHLTPDEIAATVEAEI